MLVLLLELCVTRHHTAGHRTVLEHISPRQAEECDCLSADLDIQQSLNSALFSALASYIFPPLCT